MSMASVRRIVLTAFLVQCFILTSAVHAIGNTSYVTGDPPMKLKTQIGMNFEAFVETLAQKSFENTIDYMPLCAFDDISQQDVILEFQHSDSLMPAESVTARIIDNKYYEGRSNWYARLIAEFVREFKAGKNQKATGIQAPQEKLNESFGEENVRYIKAEGVFRVKSRVSYYAVHESGSWKFVEVSAGSTCLPLEAQQALE